MDNVICTRCGAAFPQREEIIKNGRTVSKDWATDPAATCPACRGLAAPAMPKKDVLGGYPPGRKAQIQGAKK